MIQVLLKFFSILSFVFSGSGILLMIAEYMMTGKVIDGRVAVPSAIRMLLYLGATVLGATLWTVASQVDQKKQE